MRSKETYVARYHGVVSFRGTQRSHRQPASNSKHTGLLEENGHSADRQPRIADVRQGRTFNQSPVTGPHRVLYDGYAPDLVREGRRQGLHVPKFSIPRPSPAEQRPSRGRTSGAPLHTCRLPDLSYLQPSSTASSSASTSAAPAPGSHWSAITTARPRTGASTAANRSRERLSRGPLRCFGEGRS